MARDWVKLHTRLLDDADINGLSAETGWTWTRMMVLAGRNEDNGRIGTAKNAAYVLHTTVAVINAAVAELDGRVTVAEDGELWFRDWQDWQSQSERERQRAHRAGKVDVTADEQPEPVTDGHDLSRPVTDGHVSERSSSSKPDETSSEETSQEDSPSGEGTAPAVAAPASATEPDEPAPPKREPLGPGAKLFKALTHASPNIEQRSLLDAAYERHGPEKFEAVIREWLRLGYRKQNADGMVNVMERGWTKRQPANGRGVLANGHGASPEEAAAIDQVIADGMADVVARLEAPASAPADADRLWGDVHAGLALRMPAATLKAWVDPVQVASFDGETLTLLAPSAAVHSWLTQRLARELDEALADVAPGARVVVLAPEKAMVAA